MNLLLIFSRWFIRKKPKHCLSHSAQISPKAKITGKVFIDENTYIGHSQIIATENFIVTIGKETKIRDNSLIKTNESEVIESSVKDIHGIFIGSKVFISSEVTIYGSCIVSDRTFIGSKVKIENAIIGSGCLIEDNVTIKNTIIPSDTVIPSNTIINSTEDLEKVLSQQNTGDYCKYSPTNKKLKYSAINPTKSSI